MGSYKAPLEDYRFLMHELFDYTDIAPRIGHPDLDAELLDMMLEEWATFIEEVWYPSNRIGDEEGLIFSKGTVTMPPILVDVWRQTVESEWMAAPCDEEWGGQGLPTLVSTAVLEMWKSSNLAFSLCQMLTLGAVEAIAHHGSDALQRRFLAPMVEGRWTGTMNLTEPQAGSDLAALRTKERLRAELAAEHEARTLYKEAREYCESVGDYVTKNLFEELMTDEEGHIDYLETQIELHDTIGAQNFGQLNAFSKSYYKWFSVNVCQGFFW